MHIIKRLMLMIIFIITLHQLTLGQNLKIASLGDFKLKNGGVVKQCQLSYRIFGKLNEAKTNAVLLPTWFNGNTQGWIPFLGKDGYIDTIQYAAIAIDAFGAGKSSSPSDLIEKSDEFPAITIRDMVNAQYQLLKNQLHIPSLHAIIGVSMGGMQAFEWAIGYPGFAGKIVSIEGTPKLSAYDLVVWSTLVELLESEKKYDLNHDSVAVQYARLFFLIGSTPDAINEIKTEDLEVQLKSAAKRLSGIPFENALLQIRAMISHDISRDYDHNMLLTQQNFKSKLLVIATHDDHVVSAQPALDVASAIGGEKLILKSKCGHQVYWCEKSKIGEAIRAYLGKE